MFVIFHSDSNEPQIVVTTEDKEAEVAKKYKRALIDLHDEDQYTRYTSNLSHIEISPIPAQVNADWENDVADKWVMETE